VNSNNHNIDEDHAFTGINVKLQYTLVIGGVTHKNSKYQKKNTQHDIV